MPSFDVVSEVDLQEVENAVNQARKEVVQRYDFRGANVEIEWDKVAVLTITAADEFKVRAAEQVLREKLAKRQVAMKSLETGEVDAGASGRARQEVRLKMGIDQDRARKLVKIIKERKLKVQAQIQGDQLRVSGKKRDELQAVIAELRGLEFDLPLQFTNMRD